MRTNPAHFRDVMSRYSIDGCVKSGSAVVPLVFDSVQRLIPPEINRQKDIAEIAVNPEERCSATLRLNMY